MQEKNRLLSLGIEPDNKTISENLGVSEKAVALMDHRLGPSGGEVSIDRPLFDDDSSGSLGDILENHDMGIEEAVGNAQGMEILKGKLHHFVKDLKKRDRDIFKKRLLSEVPPSLQSIADEYGVSRERIRQIEERLLNKLKVYMSEFIR